MRSALLIWGGWEGHQPRQCVERISPLLESDGFLTIISDSLDTLCDTRIMASVDLIVPCWTMGEISADQFSGLENAVRAGSGLAGWHGGMCDAFRSCTEYQWMTGGQFVAHPGNIIDYVVHIENPSDPIVAGLNDFVMHSEQYYMHVDPSNEVLATTTFDGRHASWCAGCVMPVAWKRRYGEGKVFYSALGHAPQDFDVPECLEILRRGMRWAARS
ncbi:MAG: hypothetical protein AMXMBFR84_13030 [Candidatus Hydrogenedentota bacterium]